MGRASGGVKTAHQTHQSRLHRQRRVIIRRTSSRLERIRHRVGIRRLGSESHCLKKSWHHPGMPPLQLRNWQSGCGVPSLISKGSNIGSRKAYGGGSATGGYASRNCDSAGPRTKPAVMTGSPVASSERYPWHVEPRHRDRSDLMM